MSPIDALIPLVIGLLLVVRPRAFIPGAAVREGAARREATLRRIGYVLLGVALLYAILAWVERR